MRLRRLIFSVHFLIMYMSRFFIFFDAWVLDCGPDFWSITDDPGPERHNADWMKKVSDSKFLSQLSIPGTHQTMSYAFDVLIFKQWVRCQSLSLSIQLNMGVRFLDIRCQASNGDMLLNHEGYQFGKLNLKDTLSGCVNFLQSYPSECLILRIKQENSNLEGLDFRDALEPFLESFSRHILKTKSMPTLGEARGKMVILADYKIEENDNIMKYKNMIINDNWKPADYPEKINGIKANISKASSATLDRNKMYITFTSFIFCKWNSVCLRPLDTAYYINPQAHNLVDGHKGCLGIFVMDYPGYKLIRDIIDHNPFCAGLKCSDLESCPYIAEGH